MGMQQVGRTLLWALTVSLFVAAVLLFLLFRYVLPGGLHQPRYTVGEWQGQVAVFESGTDTPRQVFDTYVETLPELQQRQLQQGIPADSEDALALRLEDYTD